MKQKFIAVEGGEGSGKSSLLSALKAEFGNSIITTREPGGSPYAEVIRDVVLKHPLAGQASPSTMLCLMFASRFDHVGNTVKPAIDHGRPVITDRFDASSYAYNVWAQSKGTLEDVFWELRKQLPIIPDIYVYIDVEVREGLRRVQARNERSSDGNHFDDKEVEFHEQLREGYERFFFKVPHIVIDANRPFEAVKKDFIAEIKKQSGIS